MPTVDLDGITFHYLDLGTGMPFLFQHGLGGSVDQPAGLFAPPRGVRFLSLDARAHGKTRPLGDPDKIGITAFADDLAAFLDHLGIAAAVVGGISMGAAVALRFALVRPERVLGLVLSRPAWLDGPMQRNARIYAHIASLLREHGARDGRERFRASADYHETLALSSDAAASLLGQFDAPNAEAFVSRLERIPRDAPCRSLDELDAITAPALVLANRQDPIHPFEYGEVIAARIRGAVLREVTPKSVSRDRHAADVQRELAEFLDARRQHSPQLQRNASC